MVGLITTWQRQKLLRLLVNCTRSTIVENWQRTEPFGTLTADGVRSVIIYSCVLHVIYLNLFYIMHHTYIMPRPLPSCEKSINNLETTSTWRTIRQKIGKKNLLYFKHSWVEPLTWYPAWSSCIISRRKLMVVYKLPTFVS
jgi:hypothetical protein